MLKQGQSPKINPTFQFVPLGDAVIRIHGDTDGIAAAGR